MEMNGNDHDLNLLIMTKSPGWVCHCLRLNTDIRRVIWYFISLFIMHSAPLMDGINCFTVYPQPFYASKEMV